jgi:2-keto-4-pentenoate hydratase/2-oxohepta-3-ene-1,7-dioic acid hydratase in catechol pathway
VAQVSATRLTPHKICKSPEKIFGIGRNYRAHAAELGNEVPSTPLSLLKPPSCLLVSGDPLPLPRGYERIDIEAELVVVVGRRARAVAAADAWRRGYLDDLLVQSSRAASCRRWCSRSRR